MELGYIKKIRACNSFDFITPFEREDRQNAYKNERSRKMKDLAAKLTGPVILSN